MLGGLSERERGEFFFFFFWGGGGGCIWVGGVGGSGVLGYGVGGEWGTEILGICLI